MSISSGTILNPLLDVPVPKLAAIITEKILSYGTTELTSTLCDRAILVSLSELATVSVDEAPQASETFLAIYLSLVHENRAPSSSFN